MSPNFVKEILLKSTCDGLSNYMKSSEIGEDRTPDETSNGYIFLTIGDIEN